MSESKINRVFNALIVDGQALTAKQIKARYRAGNPYQIIATLRQEGYDIELTETTNSKGQVVNKYALSA